MSDWTSDYFRYVGSRLGSEIKDYIRNIYSLRTANHCDRIMTTTGPETESGFRSRVS
jgi:hypothetical protein